MFWIAAVSYAFVGIIAGILAGLLGVSGGMITVPCLVLIFRLMGFSPETLVQMAIGTSLAAMIFNALTSTWSHHKRRSVMWQVVGSMVPGLILGAVLGSAVAKLLSSDLLGKIFGLFECVIAVYFFLPSKRNSKDEHFQTPGLLALNGIGFGIGGLSSFLGIGGGVITVPICMSFDMPLKKAIGTSAASGLIITFIGAVSYLLFSYKLETEPMSLGYLYLPAFFIISIFTAGAAPLGAKWAHILPSHILRRIFACMLLIAGLLMIL